METENELTYQSRHSSKAYLPGHAYARPHDYRLHLMLLARIDFFLM